jgi:hypothetical protein
MADEKKRRLYFTPEQKELIKRCFDVYRDGEFKVFFKDLHLNAFLFLGDLKIWFFVQKFL